MEGKTELPSVPKNTEGFRNLRYAEYETKISFKCLFYKDRICHVRQYLNLTNENLREEKITTVTEREGRVIQDVPHERVTGKYSANIAHWLVSEFCRICPHREA